ncbi:ATP-binding cassette domain-containing protein [Alkalibaculum sp. M08DMB]|uniref:ATP-binding cassette domain-containing protein n=1 Tax=Alkalibaculum sporogenes TaxID=2655001 RepID=A0A6A7K9X7_9FIRM|nr:ATP-binding cassette domain-containing protein [Alkalibaculum sporogenes]
MLEINNITVQYNENSPCVKDFSLTMKSGEIVSIVGESGSGKTTVIRSLLGALPEGGRVEEGDIVFEGESLLDKSPEEWRKLRGTKISMIFQDSGAMINPIRKIGSQFVEYIRTHENILKKDAWQKGVIMLEKMRLPNGENIMNSYPFQLSGGMRQRVGIAMAMVFQPKLLLADEPTSALDVTTQAQIVRQMVELREVHNTGIIIVTHNLGVASYMSDKIVVMQSGKVVETGNKEEIIYNPKHTYTKKLLEAVPKLEGKRYV